MAVANHQSIEEWIKKFQTPPAESSQEDDEEWSLIKGR